jgi:hypothetical protein
MSNDRLRDDIAGLKREMRQAWQEIAKRPIKVKGGGAASPELRLVIIQGNTLATGQDGIKYSASPITDVPSAYDPTSPGSAIDGVGWGDLYTDGAGPTPVLVVNDGGGGSVINFDLVGEADPDVGSVVAAPVTLTVGGDPDTTVTAYRPDSLVG